MIRILFAGDFDPEYNRTKILLKGLSFLEYIEVIIYTFKTKSFDKKKYSELEDRCDAIFLPSFSHSTANLILRKAKKPVIFDPLISKYLTKVFDYKQVGKYSVRAYKNFKKDQLPMRNCTHLIADTIEHKKYYNQTFNVSINKISILPVGVDCNEFKPVASKGSRNKFIVGFYGGFIPLQGVRYILEAALELRSYEDIEFRLIGTGFEFEKMKQIVSNSRLENVKLLGWLEANELPKQISEFDICLGIFGNTIKAQLVIPNKIFHYAAMAKPILTMNTPAIKEVFTDLVNIFLIDVRPGALSNEILRQKEEGSKNQIIGDNSRSLVESQYSEIQIALKFVNIVEGVL